VKRIFKLSPDPWTIFRSALWNHSPNNKVRRKSTVRRGEGQRMIGERTELSSKKECKERNPYQNQGLLRRIIRENSLTFSRFYHSSHLSYIWNYEYLRTFQSRYFITSGLVSPPPLIACFGSFLPLLLPLWLILSSHSKSNSNSAVQGKSVWTLVILSIPTITSEVIRLEASPFQLWIQDRNPCLKQMLILVHWFLTWLLPIGFDFLPFHRSTKLHLRFSLFSYQLLSLLIWLSKCLSHPN